MKKLQKLALGITTIILSLGLGVMVVSAEENCVVTDGSITITGSTMCVLTEAVDEINIESTIAELGDVLNAFNLNAGYGYATFAGSAIINATVTDIFSTDNITWLAGLAPTGAVVRITPVVSDVVYILPFTMPTGFSIDFTGKTVNIPATTDVAEAVALFNSLGAKIVAAGSKYNITAEGSGKITTVHLNEGQNLADMFALITAETLDNIIVAVPDYHINLLGDAPVIWLEGDLTEAQVLALVKDLNVNATVKLLNSDAFTVTLEVGKAPVVNYKPQAQTPNEDDPQTGTLNTITSLIVSGLALTALIYSIKSKKELA